MIKCILFDLDGVLIDTKAIHYETLNAAILQVVGQEYIISMTDHMKLYDGLKTNDKLKLLTQTKGLPEESYSKIWSRKQDLTLDIIINLRENTKLIVLCEELRSHGYVLGCCSNSIQQTVLISLNKIGIESYMDVIFSNEDVVLSKPHPSIYWRAMMDLNVYPEETLIIEDSPHGLLAAATSGAHVLRVKNSEDVSVTKIMDKIHNIENNTTNPIPKWQGGNMNILIPMAGAGSRFESAGYTFPKPLIDVFGKPMIQAVVENLNVTGRFIFVVQKAHREKYNLDSLLTLVSPGSILVEVDGVTEGAACTTLLAKKYIDNDQPLMMANSDQFLEWNSNEFMYKMEDPHVDAGMVTFTATHPKWSFAKIDDMGYVTEVAEKNPISNIATVGVYYWAKGSDYVKYAENMIEKNIRTNGEFYVCPVFNQAIEDGKKVKTFNVDKMWGLGTPEDLTYFVESNK